MKLVTGIFPLQAFFHSIIRVQYCAFIALALIVGNAAAAPKQTTVKSIAISGNHAVTERQILDVILTKAGSAYSELQMTRDLENIAGLYRNEGYYSVDVRLTAPVYNNDSTLIDLHVSIEEGGRGTIAAIQLEGNSLFTTDEILSAFDTRVNTVLNSSTLEHDIDLLVDRYEKAGYPFADVKIENIVPVAQDSSRGLSIALSIDEGSKVRINEFRISGNSETSEHVIIRETGITQGELYNPDKVANIRKKLNRLNIFSQVDEPELYVVGEGTGGIQIKVKEGNTNTFDGILGFIPGSGTSGDQGYFTGLVNVSMRNLFGTARKFSVSWQKDDRFSQELGFHYLEPWILDLPLDLEGSFDQRQQDTTYVRRALIARANLHLSDAFSLGGILNSETIIPSASIAAISLNNSNTLTAGIELRFDSRDDIVSPVSGVLYTTDFEAGSKKITGGTAIAARTELHNVVQRLSIDAEMYVQAVSRQVIAIGLHGRQLTSGNIEISDLYRFGGATTLRGYGENQFLGSRIAWTNAEYRFIMARHSYFFGFFDTGYYFLPADPVNGTTENQHFRYGYGIGTRFETSLGNIGVSFALGQGDTFSQGKIHVGLINDF